LGSTFLDVALYFLLLLFVSAGFHRRDRSPQLYFSAAQPSTLAKYSLGRDQGGSQIAVLRIPRPLRGFSVSPARVAGRCAARYAAAQPTWLAGLYGLGRNLSGARIAVRRIPWPFAASRCPQPAWLADVLRGCLELLRRGHVSPRPLHSCDWACSAV
jgi:hypothetical protein